MNDAKIFSVSIMLLAALLFLPACARSTRKKKPQVTEKTTLWDRVAGTRSSRTEKRDSWFRKSKKIEEKPKSFWGS